MDGFQSDMNIERYHKIPSNEEKILMIVDEVALHSISEVNYLGVKSNSFGGFSSQPEKQILSVLFIQDW